MIDELLADLPRSILTVEGRRTAERGTDYATLE
jgi:hypothetical protein